MKPSNTVHYEYVRGDVTTNTVESYLSVFKRGMRGVYQHCTEKHLHRYLAEFDFRYNHRIALGCNDGERAALAVKGAAGKRLTYLELSRSALTPKSCTPPLETRRRATAAVRTPPRSPLVCRRKRQ